MAGILRRRSFVRNKKRNASSWCIVNVQRAWKTERTSTYIHVLSVIGPPNRDDRVHNLYTQSTSRIDRMQLPPEGDRRVARSSLENAGRAAERDSLGRVKARPWVIGINATPRTGEPRRESLINSVGEHRARSPKLVNYNCQLPRENVGDREEEDGKGRGKIRSVK